MIEEELDDKIAEIETRHFKVQNSWYTAPEINQLAIRDVAWLLDQLKLYRKALKKAVSDHVSERYDELAEPRQTEKRTYALLQDVADAQNA